ncbi:hypothetical protein MBANPS3_004988 [Mucor bainieri]
MEESQLRLTVNDAIVLPRTFEQGSDHSIVRAYTLNPEGRVMLKVNSLLLSEVTKHAHDLSLSRPGDALAITASGNLLPYNRYKNRSQHRFYPSIMVVDELTLISNCVSIPTRVRQMMDEEGLSTSTKKPDEFYSGPLTSSTTIYPGSPTYYDMLSGHGSPPKERGDTTPTEATPKAAGFLFRRPSPKPDASSRQGFKKLFDNTYIFRKRTVDSSDEGYLKKARGSQKSTWGSCDTFNEHLSRQAANDTALNDSSKQHSHRLPRKASNVKKYPE